MNIEPALYAQKNKLQRNEAEKIIDEFADKFQLRSDGKDSLIDIGCGPGDVLMDFILPILPANYSKVVGIDISPKMIQYSKETYAQHNKVDFKMLDIGTDTMSLEYQEQFDHVTSFFCLHWVQNQKQVLKNIYNMLIKGGDCLLVSLASSPVFDAFHTIAKDTKWSDYMKDVDKFVPPLQKHPDPWLAYTNQLTEAGFVNPSVEILHRVYVFESNECLRNLIISVIPFVERIPIDKREVYTDEMLEKWKEMCVTEKKLHNDEYRYVLPYDVIVAYAKK